MLEEFQVGLSQLPKVLTALEKKIEASKDFNKELTAESLPFLAEYILALLILEDLQCLAWLNSFQSVIARENKFEEYDLIRRTFLTATLKLQGFQYYDWPEECKSSAVLNFSSAAYFLFNPEAIFDCEKAEPFSLCFEVLCKIVVRLAEESFLSAYLAARKVEMLLDRKFELSLEEVQKWLAENPSFEDEALLEKNVSSFFKVQLEDYEKATLLHDLGVVCILNEKNEWASQLLSEALALRTKVFGEKSPEVSLTLKALEEVKVASETGAPEKEDAAESSGLVDTKFDEEKFLKKLLELLDLNLLEEAKNLIQQRLQRF